MGSSASSRFSFRPRLFLPFLSPDGEEEEKEEEEEEEEEVIKRPVIVVKGRKGIS